MGGKIPRKKARDTMKQLRQYIRQILIESISLIDSGVVGSMESNDLIFVVYMGQYDGDIYLCERKDFDKEYEDVTDHVGKIQLSWLGKETLQVEKSDLVERFRSQGIGALMYNVALSMCTINGNWLMADRTSVSTKADRIYDYWMSEPSTYAIEQTDETTHDEKGYGEPDGFDPEIDYLLTKTRVDDFEQGSFQQKNASWSDYSDDDPRAQRQDGLVKDWWYFFSGEYKEDFLASGLTKRYKMKDANGFIKALEEQNLLYTV